MPPWLSLIIDVIIQILLALPSYVMDKLRTKNRRFQYGKLPKYRHMSQRDAIVWNRFIDQQPDYFDEVLYDYPLGPGSIDDDDMDNVYKQDYKHVSRLRADVVGLTDYMHTVIEIKPRCQADAIGQVLVYTFHYRHLVGDSINVQSMVICHRCDENVRDFANEHDIIIFEVG